MEAYLIVKQMHEAFPRVVKRLARIAGKSEEWFHSHGREPKTTNPLQSGNKSPVTFYMEYLHQNEAAEPGAGIFLNNRVHASMCAEFADSIDTDQGELHCNIIDEASDVKRWLATHNLEHATERQLLVFEKECDEAREAIDEAKAKARSIRRQMESGLKAVA